MRILVTGATGFVGRRLCAELSQQGYSVRAATRDAARAASLRAELAVVRDFQQAPAWSAAVQNVEAVIHLAARVHVMKEDATDPLAEFRATNVYATRALALAAVQAGVRRVVYVSSVKVNGESTVSRPFGREDVPAPIDAYGISKWEAECALQQIARDSGLELAIVRPPLVYGPGVGGNFLRLLKLVRSRIPLPLAQIKNRRSMIYNGNLARALISCAVHPQAAGNIYFVSDDEALSTPQLIQRLAAELARPARLWALPAGLLGAAAAACGKAPEVDRLIGSLIVDSSPIRAELAWSPPFSVDEGLAETARWFASARR